jgi:hypothetical protein
MVRPLRQVTNALVLYVFVVSPVVILWCGLKGTWPGLLAGVVLLTLACSLLFRQAHRRLYPAADDDRFTHGLTILLSPASAMRACDVLSRPLPEDVHPLALAGSLGSPDQWRRMARSAIKELRYPAQPETPTDDRLAVGIDRDFRSRWAMVLGEYLAARQLSEEELLAPPVPADNQCRAYCPRCEAQFTRAEEVCRDCGGLPLRPLAG